MCPVLVVDLIKSLINLTHDNLFYFNNLMFNFSFKAAHGDLFYVNNLM